MKNTMKKVMGMLMAAVLLAGGLAVPSQSAQAAKVFATHSVMVGKKLKISNQWEGPAKKWTVIKGQSNIKIIKKSDREVTIKAVKKGTALLQVDIGSIKRGEEFYRGGKEIFKVNVIGKTMTVTYKGKFSKNQKEDIRTAGEAGAKIKVVVKKGIKSIGNNAFYQLPIIDVTIPDSVKSIGKLAFGDCEKLKSVKIPNGVKSINNYTFQSCTGLKSVEIPDSVESIGKSAFYECTNLKSVKIPDGVKSIGESAFGDCEKLKSITWQGKTYSSVSDFEEAFRAVYAN